MIVLSIDESIQRLKAEIIAQDWSLSEKRIELLEAAFSCLKQRFKNRKAAQNILIMAGSVLDYVRRKGENTPADSIDFLKEAMAHVVSLYESEEFDPDQDEKIFKGLYFRFNVLKEKIKAEKMRELGQTVPAGEEMIRKDPRIKEDDENGIFVPENVDQLREKVALLREQEQLNLDRDDFEKLVDDLQLSLERAEHVGETIKQLLSELLVAEKALRAAGEEKPDESEPEPVKLAEPPKSETVEKDTLPPERVVRQTLIKSCPATELREIILDGSRVYIQESAIAMIREVAKSKQSGYIKNCYVPLKDFGGLFRSLAKQFKGSLSTIPDKKLKKLALPIMVPRGMGLPDIPDENGSKLVFVTNGQWNGILVCSEVGAEPVTMVKFQKAKNGDVVGVGYAKDGLEFPLLNVVSILRREGFLTMV